MERKSIPVDQLAIDTAQSRRGKWEGDEQDEQLVASIKGTGLIHDVIVRPTDNDEYGAETDKPYAIVAGSRRYHALIQAGETEVPCVVMGLDDLEAANKSLTENLGRKDLSEYEKAEQVKLIYDLLVAEKVDEACPVCGKTTERPEGLKQHYNREHGGSADNMDVAGIYTPTDAKQEIADEHFNGHVPAVNQYLRAAGLPDDLKTLIKDPDQRSDQERELLDRHNIDLDYTAQVIGSGVAPAIQSLSEHTKKENVLQVIGELELDEERRKEQRRVLMNMKDRLESGEEFDVVMEEAKEETVGFEMVQGGEIDFSVDLDLSRRHRRWHSRAVANTRMEEDRLVKKVYAEWLEEQAEQSGWVDSKEWDDAS